MKFELDDAVALQIESGTMTEKGLRPPGAVTTMTPSAGVSLAAQDLIND